MWGHHHHKHDHHFGGRGGGFRRGPLEVEWSFGEGGGGHGRFGWGGRGGGRRRVLDGEELKLILLALIAEAPRHGYDLIKEIEARSNGAYAPSPGTVYPTLTLLDEMGHVDEVKEEGARRRFAITPAGQAHLDERRADADALLARLAELGEDRARNDRAPLRRAFMGLGMAVREAMTAARGDEERGHDIAAILDEAARKIERL